MIRDTKRAVQQTRTVWIKKGSLADRLRINVILAYNLAFPAHYFIKALANAPGIIILCSFLFHSWKTSAPMEADGKSVCNVCLILVQLCQNPNTRSADK